MEGVKRVRDCVKQPMKRVVRVKAIPYSDVRSERERRDGISPPVAVSNNRIFVQCNRTALRQWD